MDSITSGEVDIYAELGVPRDASTKDISRQYRQLALRYHPDKNSSADAAEKFHWYSTIHSVLAQSALRRQYDEIYDARQNADAAAPPKVAMFREQLRRAEAELAQKRTKKSQTNVENLKMKGLRLRREHELARQARKYVSYADIPVKRSVNDFVANDNVVSVVWKKREEATAQIDSSALTQIMSVFGDVVLASVESGGDRYARGSVEYGDMASARKAAAHDYRKSAHLWDGTPVRKLASLLRDVQPRSGSSAVDEIFAERANPDA